MKEKFYKNIPLDDRAETIVDELESEFEEELPDTGKPFPTLVRTVLSQNTNRSNTSKAFDNLKKNYRTSSDYAYADIEDLKKQIKPAGLYNSKSKTLKRIGEIVEEKYDGELEKILEKGVEKAREDLLEIPGVGPKTADCVLLFSGGFDVLPVDTHVHRTTKRLGLVDEEKDHEGVKESVESILDDGRLGKAHILLIELGREYCRARNPKCESCPVEKYCPKAGLED